MEHPIVDYWNQAFSYYRVSRNSFFCEEMTDPILSPNFVSAKELAKSSHLSHLNLVLEGETSEPPMPAGFTLRNRFYLCQMQLEDQELDFEFEIQPLSIAKTQKGHQELLQDGFEKDFQFLKHLEDFLPRLNANYYVSEIYENNKPFGSLTMGVAGDTAVLLSGVIHSDFRNQKHSRKLKALVNGMGARLGAKRAFYWTLSERLKVYADKVDQYLVYVRSSAD